MINFLLTGVHQPGTDPPYSRPKFIALILKWVTQDIQAANQYATAVEQGQPRHMVAPGIIATELDVAGVYHTP